jgi:hypothetical protein
MEDTIEGQRGSSEMILRVGRFSHSRWGQRPREQGGQPQACQHSQGTHSGGGQQEKARIFLKEIFVAWMKPLVRLFAKWLLSTCKVPRKDLHLVGQCWGQGDNGSVGNRGLGSLGFPPTPHLPPKQCSDVWDSVILHSIWPYSQETGGKPVCLN